VLGRDPLSGHVFVFLNRRKTQVKLLLWTRGGSLSTTLNRGDFRLRNSGHQAACGGLDVHELGMLLEGIDMTGAKSRRWEPPHTQCGVNDEASEQRNAKRNRATAVEFSCTRKIVLVYRDMCTASKRTATETRNIVDCRAGRAMCGMLQRLLAGRSNEVVALVTKLSRAT